MMQDTGSGLRLLGIVLVIGFLLNYVWEIAQLPAYTDGLGRPLRLGVYEAALHCLMATVGDALVVGLTFVLGWAIHSRYDWIHQLGWRGVFLVSLPLVELAIIVEIVAVDQLQWWGYSDLMPVLPLLQVVLLPTIQLAVLTLLAFGIAGRIVSWRRAES